MILDQLWATRFMLSEMTIQCLSKTQLFDLTHHPDRHGTLL